MARVIKTQIEFEGRFYDRYIIQAGEDPPAWDRDRALSVVGEPMPRFDGAERVTGTAKYTHDIALPGMLYGKFLHCPHAHARIKRLNADQAQNLNGVHIVLSHRNTPEIPWRYGQTALFDRTLRYAGEEVACVIAEDEEVCEDALKRIEVDYKILPFVLDPQEALDPKAPKVRDPCNLLNGQPEMYERGDVEKGFSDADVIVETGAIRVQRLVAIHESGRVVNPLLIQSQLEGRIIQGLGFALTEQRFVDPRTGIVVNANLDHYKVPTSEDVGEIAAEMVDLPDPEANNVGAKGVGEPPIIPVAGAIANALADALGRRMYELPLTPDRVLSLMDT